MLFTLAGVDMGIELTTRMGLMGANGAGKSTLVKLITGQLSPSSGEVVHPRHFKIGAFTQHHMDQLDLDMSPLEYLFEMAKVRLSFCAQRALGPLVR